MTTIKELDLMKRKLHKDKYESTYPNGMFSIERFDGDNPLIYLSWSKKSSNVEAFSTHYNASSFSLSNHLVFDSYIHRSWRAKVNRYNTIEGLVRRARKLGVTYRQLSNYVTLYLKFSGSKGTAYKILNDIK